MTPRSGAEYMPSMRINRLARVLTTLGYLATIARPVVAQRPPPVAPRDTVLFICEHGTVRSLMATLLFERYAREAGLRMTAISRGTAIDSVVPPWLQRALTTDHFVLGAWHPQALSATDLASARYVVSFDLPTAISAGARSPRAQWDSLPSVSANYVAGRDAIDARVRRLVDSLKRARVGPRP